MIPQVTQTLPDGANPLRGEPVLPPRPNLGPEPWPNEAGGIGWGLLFSVLVLLLALGLLVWTRMQGMGRRRADRQVLQRGQNLHLPSPTPDDPRIHHAEMLRDALIAAFGPSWRAKTTEEIAAEPELLNRLGPERSAQVVTLLSEADRAKFAGSATDRPLTSEDDTTRLAELISLLNSPSTGAGRG
ncbi:hypothetical protein [Tautonia rosea]|uniref:hypothetical protein n=1 Tax=Tautonia rosea TaxID=2728037 RepID=UPI0014741E5D|nr:hypothetical protein [Tautonia rosea]